MSSLKTLRIRVDHLVLGIVGVAVVVGGLIFWRATRPDPQQRAEVEHGFERVRAKQGDTSPRFVRGYWSGASEEPEGEGKVTFTPPVKVDPGDVGSAEAVDGFRDVMSELEAALASGRKLSRSERAEYYARATGSFTALSSWVDPRDASERAMMDDAYAQMMSLMRELDIRPPRPGTETFVRPD